MAASPIDKIVDLLTDEAPEKRIAAAIVVGELKVKGAAAVAGLLDMLETGGPAMQRHALDALARVGGDKSLPKVLPFLAARDDDVRAAAVEAVTAVGDSVIPIVKKRLADATPAERRALDAILARVGGKDAFATLLDSLDTDDAEIAHRRALEMRQQIRDADGRQRRSYQAQIEKFLAKVEKRKDGSASTSPVAIAAAVKVLGFLEDPATLDTLLGYVKGKKVASEVRKEALIGLRFAMQDDSVAGKVMGALADAAESEDRALAQTALMTLAGMDLPAKLASRFESLLSHPDIERAHIVIEKLKQDDAPEVSELLVSVLANGEDRRAELAAKALEGRENAVKPLVDALVGVKSEERARLIRRVLRPHAEKLAGAQRKKLLDRVAKATPGWREALDVAYASDPKSTAKALRELVVALKRSKKLEPAIEILRELSRGAEANDEDRYLLASLELARSRLDTRPAARQGDPALRSLWDLRRRGYDVYGALKRDRSVGLEQLYYIGFHFVEERHPLGEDILGEVVAKAGKKKIGKAAKNKLALAERT